MKIKFRFLLFIVYVLIVSSVFGMEGERNFFPNEEILLGKLKNKFIAKNVCYEFKEILPEVEGQILICSDGFKFWLELTNFEFLINSEESNKIVTVYIGDVGDRERANKIVIEIFGPEASFVFQDAIIRFFDNYLDGKCVQFSDPYLRRSFCKENMDISVSKLMELVRIGYEALSYHFGFPVSHCEELNEELNIEQFKKLQQSLHQKYENDMASIDRLVTREIIEKRKAQGLKAYYPNPFYMYGIAWRLRPKGTDYNNYVLGNMFNFRGNVDCDGAILSKYPNITYDREDKLSPIFERVFKDKKIRFDEDYNESFYCAADDKDCSFDEDGMLYTTDLNRISAYVYRGDHRDVDDIYNDRGFWHRIYGKGYSEEKNKRLLNDDKAFRRLAFLSWAGIGVIVNTTLDGSAYIPSSLVFSVARVYGRYVYSFFVEGGLLLPGLDHWNNEFRGGSLDVREVAVPVGVSWENIAGVRESTTELGKDTDIRFNFDNVSGDKLTKHLIGPVYLKDGFAELEPDNFWEMLQVMGGKQQCLNLEELRKQVEIANMCIDLPNYSDWDAMVDICKLNFQAAYKMNEEEAQKKCNMYFENLMKEWMDYEMEQKEWRKEICQKDNTMCFEESEEIEAEKAVSAHIYNVCLNFASDELETVLFSGPLCKRRR